MLSLSYRLWVYTHSCSRFPGDFSVLLKIYCAIFMQRKKKKQDALYSGNTNKTIRAAPPGQMSFDTSILSLRGGCWGDGATYSDPIGMAPKTFCEPQQPAARVRPEREHLPRDSSYRCCSMPTASPGPAGLCVHPQVSSIVPDKQG